jgi:site-specific recombinase XerD
MELSVKEFLDSVTNPNTKKEYRYGIKKFYTWFGKTPGEILKMRQDDLMPKEGESLVEQRFRAARFQREIEKFHSYIIEEGKSINTARTATLGIRQLFRFYQMPVVMRSGSRVTKTVKTTKSFPLRIDHVRAMFEVADLRERVILSVATDLASRISDFIKLRKSDLPDLNQEPPISFEIMTKKEDVIAHSFLSIETVELLKSYLIHLDQREQDRKERAKREGRRHRENPYLFPSNSTRHISEERVNALLKILAEKAQINTNNKRLTFHCFRKMFLSASIDSGIGLTAGKKLVGKSIPQSDDTYLTNVQLREKFIQLKKYLTIKQKVKPENHERIEELSKAVLKLQEDVNTYKTVAETVTKENKNLAAHMAKLQPLVDLVNSYGEPEDLKRTLDFIIDNLEDRMQAPLKALVEEHFETLKRRERKLKKK